MYFNTELSSTSYMVAYMCLQCFTRPDSHLEVVILISGCNLNVNRIARSHSACPFHSSGAFIALVLSVRNSEGVELCAPAASQVKKTA